MKGTFTNIIDLNLRLEYSVQEGQDNVCEEYDNEKGILMFHSSHGLLLCPGGFGTDVF